MTGSENEQDDPQEIEGVQPDEIVPPRADGTPQEIPELNTIPGTTGFGILDRIKMYGARKTLESFEAALEAQQGVIEAVEGIKRAEINLADAQIEHAEAMERLEHIEDYREMARNRVKADLAASRTALAEAQAEAEMAKIERAARKARLEREIAEEQHRKKGFGSGFSAGMEEILDAHNGYAEVDAIEANMREESSGELSESEQATIKKLRDFVANQVEQNARRKPKKPEPPKENG